MSAQDIMTAPARVTQIPCPFGAPALREAAACQATRQMNAWACDEPEQPYSMEDADGTRWQQVLVTGDYTILRVIPTNQYMLVPRNTHAGGRVWAITFQVLGSPDTAAEHDVQIARAHQLLIRLHYGVPAED